MGAFTHITFAAKSDVGRKRKNNEDAFGTFPSFGVYCVADGMGGGDDGEVASAATVGAVEKFVKAHPLPENVAFPPDSVIAGIRAAVNSASKWVHERAKSRKLKGCGSTFVGMCLDPSRPGEATALHAGDSRLYRIRGRGIQQITKDHSAAELIGAKNENELNPMFRGMILRAVGIQPSVEVEATPLPLKEGDCILICSDGLCRMVPDKKIVSIIRDNDTPGAAVEALIAAANEAGGIDNVTAVLVKVGKLPSPLPIVDMPKADDGSDAPTTIGDEAFESRESETSPSFDLATSETGIDASSFATAPSTSATLTGDTNNSSSTSDAMTGGRQLTGSGWKAMMETPPEATPKPRRKKAVVIVAAVVVAAAALLAVLMKGGEEAPTPASVSVPTIDQKAVEEAAKKAAEEAKKKAEAAMAAQVAEMHRKIKEAEARAVKERAEREAEAKRLELVRKAREEEERVAKEKAEAERKAAEEHENAEAARLAAEKKAAEERAAKEREEAEKRRKAAEEKAARERAEREAEAKRLEEERQKVLEAQRKQQAEADRIAKEKAAAEKAKQDAEEKQRKAEAKRLAEEDERRKAALQEKVQEKLEAADRYLYDEDIYEALLILNKVCVEDGYKLPKHNWQRRIYEKYAERMEFLSKHINNKSMAERKNLDRNKLKAEFKELGDLFGALRYEDDVSPSSGSGK